MKKIAQLVQDHINGNTSEASNEAMSKIASKLKELGFKAPFTIKKIAAHTDKRHILTYQEEMIKPMVIRYLRSDKFRDNTGMNIDPDMATSMASAMIDVSDAFLDEEGVSNIARDSRGRYPYALEENIQEIVDIFVENNPDLMRPYLLSEEATEEAPKAQINQELYDKYYGT